MRPNESLLEGVPSGQADGTSRRRFRRALVFLVRVMAAMSVSNAENLYLCC